MKFNEVGLLLEVELRRLFRQLCFSSKTTYDAEADDEEDDEDTFQGYFRRNIKAIQQTPSVVVQRDQKQKEEGIKRRKKQRKEIHMGIAGINRRLKVEQTQSVL